MSEGTYPPFNYNEQQSLYKQRPKVVNKKMIGNSKDLNKMSYSVAMLSKTFSMAELPWNLGNSKGGGGVGNKMFGNSKRGRQNVTFFLGDIFHFFPLNF